MQFLVVAGYFLVLNHNFIHRPADIRCPPAAGEGQESDQEALGIAIRLGSQEIHLSFIQNDDQNPKQRKDEIDVLDLQNDVGDNCVELLLELVQIYDNDAGGKTEAGAEKQDQQIDIENHFLCSAMQSDIQGVFSDSCL